MIPLFANPLLLWGLAAASVPVVIHLLNRRRFRVQRWAAMEWLLAAARKNQKRLQMENLLLLLLRTMAVLFLALAIARPSFSETRLTLEKQASQLFILLDNSASTGAKSGTGTALESAIDAANALVGKIGPEDPVTLVLTNDDTGSDAAAAKTSGRARVVLRATHDHAKVRQLVSDLKPAAARGDIVEALQKLEESVPARGGVRVKVAILTDLQKTSFDSSSAVGGDAKSNSSPDAAIRATLQRLKDKGADVVLTAIGRQAANVAVTALSAQDDRDIVQGATVVFDAEVRNFSDRALTAEVRFLVDGKERGDMSQQIPLAARPAGSEAPPAATAQFTTKFGEDESGAIGVHVIEARITSDALPVDDVRTFAFEVRKPIRVLAIDGDPFPTEGDAVAETHYLKDALAIKPGGPINVQVLNEEQFEAEALHGGLASWDLVILANVKNPARTSEIRKRLAEYVDGGGALYLTVGDQVVPDVWNRELYAGGSPMLPARIGEARVDKAVQMGFDLSENRHPILADITNPAAAAFFRTPAVWGRMTLLEAANEKGARVVLTYTDLKKSPALVERSFGKGRVLLFTTTADNAWTKLPGDYLNPPLLHELVYYLTSHGNSERNLLTYQTWSRAVPDGATNPVEVTKPDGSVVQEQIEKPVDSPVGYVTCGETGLVGAYHVKIPLKPADILSAAPPPLMDAFAVNLTPLESDLERMRTEDVESRWPGLIRTASSFGDAAEAMRPKGGELHVPLIIASLLCLLAEVVLVRMIARSRMAVA